MELSVQPKGMLLFPLRRVEETIFFYSFSLFPKSVVYAYSELASNVGTVFKMPVMPYSLSWQNDSQSPGEINLQIFWRSRCPQIREPWRVCWGSKWRTFNLSRLFHFKKQCKMMNAGPVLPRNRWDLPMLEHILVKHNVCTYITSEILCVWVCILMLKHFFFYKRLWNRISLGLILRSLMSVIKLPFMSVVGDEAHHSASRSPGTLNRDAYVKERCQANVKHPEKSSSFAQFLRELWRCLYFLLFMLFLLLFAVFLITDWIYRVGWSCPGYKAVQCLCFVSLLLILPSLLCMQREHAYPFAKFLWLVHFTSPRLPICVLKTLRKFSIFM